MTYTTIQSSQPFCVRTYTGRVDIFQPVRMESLDEAIFPLEGLQG